jgi:hypothetical protein
MTATPRPPLCKSLLGEIPTRSQVAPPNPEQPMPRLVLLPAAGRIVAAPDAPRRSPGSDYAVSPLGGLRVPVRQLSSGRTGSRGCECSTGEYVPGLWRKAAAFVDERDRILLLLAPFAFEICGSTLWITLVEPPMHADLAQELPHDRDSPLAMLVVKAVLIDHPRRQRLHDDDHEHSEQDGQPECRPGHSTTMP